VTNDPPAELMLVPAAKVTSNWMVAECKEEPASTAQTPTKAGKSRTFMAGDHCSSPWLDLSITV
jgi:hypothetical protein